MISRRKTKLTPRRPKKLLEEAKRVAGNAYAPYSSFFVGAAVETFDRRMFVGTNMENASYGLTVCAEIGALQAALSAGALTKIRRIAIVGGQIDNSNQKQGKPTAPCGRCRQLISEAAGLSNYDIEVWYSNWDLSKAEFQLISKLLPNSFGPVNLDK